MKKILIYLSLSLFFCWSGFAQNTYYVSPPPAGNNNNNGSAAQPWATIKYAVENAAVVNGDIIKIASSVYSERVFTIGKSITLQGTGSGAVSIGVQGASRAFVFAIGASNVLIENLTLNVNNRANNGIAVINGSSDVTIQNTLISGASNAGILVQSNVTNVVANNNNLANNSRALVNNSSSLVDASFNWWGSPERESVLAQFSGNANVDYSPWLNTATDGDATQVGFQSNLSSISLDGDSPGDGTLQEAYDIIEANDTLRLIKSTTDYNALTVNKSATISTRENEQPVIGNIAVISDTLSVDGTVLVSDDISLAAGGIKTVNEGQVTLGLNVGDVNEDAGRLRGNFTTQPTPVGTGTLSALGVNIGAGSDDLGTVTIARINGPQGIVQANNNESVAVRWNIESENPPSNGRTIKFNWRSENDNYEGGIDQVQVWRFDEALDSWELVTPNATSAPSSGTDLRSVTVSSVTEFSLWTISSVEAPLPVTLTNFIAQLDKPSVRLEWATASEINADYFSIERSTDGLIFEEIARNRAAGTSNQVRDYLYIDEGIANRLSGTLYYRLRMVDFDNSYEFSGIAAVPLNSNQDLRVYADAATATLQLFTQHLPKDRYLVQVSDMMGHVLLESSLTVSEENPVLYLPVNFLNSAVYVMRCFGSQSLFTQKFRVE